ncbi:carboxypeptidase regulatory-like domain-containing protein [Clostridium sp. AF02-29]|uniref:carboxypeptidase regulatory-like domain-containing protein n=1 Tax=Clostridium sp. AF02-29 TaxID=2292993 RepID=UPI0015F874FF|nr:carboxypeptidase regulatory-like domain-containing protein [Clostridium sp. AF02-29]
MRRRKRRILAAGMVVVITCSSYGSVPRVYANTNFYQIREIESLSEQVLYQKVPYGTRYQDLEMPDSIDVFVSGGGQNEDVPDAGNDENVAAFANRTDDDAVLEKLDSEEKGENEDTEGKDAGEDSKDKSEGEEDLEKEKSGSGEQGDSGKDGNSAENGDSQDENANPGNGESDEKDDSGKTDSGSSGGNADLNEDGSSSNGKTDEPREDVKTDEKTEEEIDEKEGFWRKVKVRWVLDAEESQASRYDGENPGIYLFRAELKSSNYEVDEDELPVIQITVLEEEQAKTTLEFAPLEESIADQILPLGSKESDIRFPETLTVRETTGEETTERTLPGITWKLDAENSDYSEFQGGLAPEDYFDRFDEDGEPEETEEKTWEGYDKANEEYNGALYTYVPVIPESEEIPEDTDLPEIHVQVGDAGIALYADEGITGSGTLEDPYVITTADQWSIVMGKGNKNQYNGSGQYNSNVNKYIKLGNNIDLSEVDPWEERTLTTCLDGDGYTLSGISQPLFSSVKGTVKNLVLSNVKIKEAKNFKHVGAIARTTAGTAIIENCYVEGAKDNGDDDAGILNTGNYAAGGLIGQVPSSSTLTVKNCVVNADVKSTGSDSQNSLAGGLVGLVSAKNILNIENCMAMGSVSTECNSGCGGLVGGRNVNVIIEKSVALQKTVSTKKLSSYVDRIFGYSGDSTVYVSGNQNYAYQNMAGGYNGNFANKHTEHHGEGVTKAELLTTNFWENKIGWGNDSNSSWKIEADQFPSLETTNGDVIFSGDDLPDYLQATNMVTGTVSSGETGLDGAEIIFKKGNSEKSTTTNADGDFEIELANGIYTVTIKKTGYLTWTDSVTIPGNLDFTLEANPVSMPARQTVTGTFQTTDAESATAEGEIKLIYAGTDSLQPKDFTLSSEEDGMEYGEVTISGVEKTENGWGIKIRFAKSLALGSINEKQLYVHYKGSLIGSITLTKEVNLVQLAAPADVKWDETVKGKAVWSPVENASGYKVQLYKNGSSLGAGVTLGADAASYDFTSQIADSGTYTFGVQATGDGSTYDDSEEEKSGTYEFSEQTLADVKKAVAAALQAKTVTNETTSEEILQVVQIVITNNKIQAKWSDEKGFKLTPATDGTDPGQNGSITGTIVLSYTADSASTETDTIEINLPIAAKYAITFVSGRKDSQGDAPTLENAAAGTVITLPENTFKVYGMNFGGWSDRTNTYASGASYTMPERNVTFEAVWTQDKWDGQTVAEPTKDDQGYYQISTGAELAYFRDTVISNWKAKLMCDIDMGGYDFASIHNAGAEFDGCGHTIRGLNVVGDTYVGLFRASSSKCEIKNLTIENAVVKASNNDARVGILVGDVYDSLTVENCYVSGTIETTDGTNKIEAAGGLIGNVRGNYSVEIQSCYADAEIKGIASSGYAGGLVGWTGGATTIDNSYAVVDMDADKGYYIGGLVGSGNVTISHSYAAGEALTAGSNVAGISDNGSISSCVSIFPEMRSLNRIGGGTGRCQGNYGFAGTVARKSDGTILTPDPNMMGADKQYGANATEAELKDPDFYKKLGWDFDSTWAMDSTGGYAFPILKNQTLRPNLTLDLKPSVTGITLDKTNETIYPRGSVQLTATVDVANGASRDVTWKSSDPAVRVEDGLVTAADVAKAGTYTITATSVAEPSKNAVCQLTVDTAEHTVTVERKPGHTNSLNAVVKAYASLDDAKGETNPISTTDSATGTVTFSRKAGETVYLAFTGLDPLDVVSEVTITDKNGSKVDATLCNFEDPTVYYFTMPCSNASVQVSYAVNLNATQYTWFVGQEWGTWGTTAAFETKEWSGGEHIGSLEVTKIINGKQFKEFNIKSMSLYKKGSVTPKKVNSRAELKKNGDYYIEKDNTTGLPTLYVYLDGPGMVAVDIEVQDDLNAVFSITQKLESSSYYTLDKITAKAGELVTATLTDAGVEQMKEMQNKNACLTYSGGLLIVVYPPKFTESGGKWTASFKMPAQDVETHVYFGDKDKVALNGTDKEVDYDGTPKSVGDGIQATIGEYDLSEQFQGQYEVHYEGVNGTVYSSMTPPTNAGMYSCRIKIPDSNVNYKSDPITVRLTIKKIGTKTPKAPQAAAWTDTSVTLKAPSAFVDGTAIPAGYELEYCADQGEWQDSPVFTGLTPETTYKFYVRLKEGVNTMASAASEAVAVQTKKASSAPSNPTKPDPSNPTPSTPGNPQGTATSSRDRSTSTWVKESAGWRYRLSNGTYLSGSLVLDPMTGRQVEQVVWKQLRGAWWAFGADGYIRTGWVYDYSAGKWYYVDENTGMRTGWYLDPQDGRWYYLDPATGEMLTEWQLIPDLGYVYLNPYAPQPTWAYDEALKTWVYMEGAGRPYGSLYMAEWTPDGYYVNADGVWEPAR